MTGRLVMVPIFGPTHMSSLDKISYSKLWALTTDDERTVMILHCDSDQPIYRPGEMLSIFESEVAHRKFVEPDELPEAATRNVAILAFGLELGEG